MALARASSGHRDPLASWGAPCGHLSAPLHLPGDRCLLWEALGNWWELLLRPHANRVLPARRGRGLGDTCLGYHGVITELLLETKWAALLSPRGHQGT